MTLTPVPMMQLTESYAELVRKHRALLVKA